MKKISEMTDRELQEGMYQNIRSIHEGVYQNIRNISKHTRRTSNWMTFIGIVAILEIIVTILVLNAVKIL